jgi:hypothetical protein
MLVSRILAASFHLENRGLRRLALLDTEICVRWRETVCGSDCWGYHGQLPEVVRVHLDWHPARCDAQLITRGDQQHGRSRPFALWRTQLTMGALEAVRGTFILTGHTSHIADRRHPIILAEL